LVAGTGRAILESYFRPDQPSFFGTPVSTSFIVAVLFALFGLFIVLVRTEKISVPFMDPGSTDYVRKTTRRAPAPAGSRRKKA
jgi:hypothetical protein